MTFRDHWRLVTDLVRESPFPSLIAVLAFIVAVFGVIFSVVLTPDQQAYVTEYIRKMLGFWQWFIIAGLVIIIAILYRQLMPTVDIRFCPHGRFIMKAGAAIKYRVDCVPRSVKPDRAVFRLESISTEGGEFLPIERRGLQREAGNGPMPLKEPKFGYIAEFDPTVENAKIMILTVSDLASGYKDDPIPLDPSVRWLVAVSLNPGIGASCQRCFRIWVDDQKRLQMVEARHSKRVV
jgi:hypothetical protein